MHSPTESGRAAGFLNRTVPVGILLLAWELSARTGFVNPYVFPPVTEILLRWAALVTSGAVFGPLLDTLWRSVGGLVYAPRGGG